MSREEFIDLPEILSASGRVQLPGSKSISNRVLLLAALASGDPVIYMEHKELWGVPGEVVPGDVVPLGKARTVREGDTTTAPAPHAPPGNSLRTAWRGLALGAATVVATEVARLNGLQRRGSPHCGCKRPIQAAAEVNVNAKVNYLTLTRTVSSPECVPPAHC